MAGTANVHWQMVLVAKSGLAKSELGGTETDIPVNFSIFLYQAWMWKAFYEWMLLGLRCYWSSWAGIVGMSSRWTCRDLAHLSILWTNSCVLEKASCVGELARHDMWEKFVCCVTCTGASKVQNGVERVSHSSYRCSFAQQLMQCKFWDIKGCHQW